MLKYLSSCFALVCSFLCIAQVAFDDVLTNPYSLQNAQNNYSIPILYDFDNDGDDDLLTWSNFGTPQLYTNSGTSEEPTFDSPSSFPFSISSAQAYFHGSPTLGDIDGDSDIDLLLGYQDGDFQLFQNTGTNSSPIYSLAIKNEYGLSAVNLNSTPAFGDLDNDGDLDVISGDRDGNFTYFHNTGASPQFPDLATKTLNPFGLVPPTNRGGYSKPVLIDMDDDGDLDLLAGYRFGYTYFENTGSPSAPAFSAPLINPFSIQYTEQWATPTFSDLDNDGDKELISGSFSGKFYVYENLRLPETFTWDGSASTDWNDEANWASNILPSNTNRVIIPEIAGRSARYPFLSSAINIDRVEINTNARVNIGANGYLAVNTLVLNDTIFVSSGGALKVSDTIKGTALAEIIRTTTHNTGKYSIIGSPMIAHSTEVMGSAIYTYDEEVAYGVDGSNRFSPLSNHGTMQTGEGYFSAYTGTLQFYGIPQYKSVNIPIKYNETNDGGATNAGYNLVSNPYSAAISYSDLIANNTDIDGTIYLWDDGGSDMSQRTNNDYITVTSAGAVGGSGRVTDWDGNIRSAQGFFVKATSAGTLNFTSSMMVTGNNGDNGYFRKSDDSKDDIRISLNNENSSSEILIAFRDEATVDFDKGLDGTKMMSAFGTQFFSLIGEQSVAIQALPYPSDFNTIDLGFHLEEFGDYDLNVSTLMIDNYEVALLDRYTGETILLHEGSKYSFSSNKGTTINRFALLISPYEILTSEKQLTDKVVLYTDENQLYIQTPFNAEVGNIRIYTLNGNQVFRADNIQFKKGQWSTEFDQSGLFILQMEMSGSITSHKFIH